MKCYNIYKALLGSMDFLSSSSLSEPSDDHKLSYMENYSTSRYMLFPTIMSSNAKFYSRMWYFQILSSMLLFWEMHWPGPLSKKLEKFFSSRTKTNISKIFYISRTNLGHWIEKNQNILVSFMQRPGLHRKEIKYCIIVTQIQKDKESFIFHGLI